jgi:hypothetical protein
MSARRTKQIVGMVLVTVVNVFLVCIGYEIVSGSLSLPVAHGNAAMTAAPATANVISQTHDVQAMPADRPADGVDYLEVRNLPDPKPRSRQDSDTTNTRSLGRARLQADIAVEADYEFYANVFGGDMVRASDYITQLLNAVSAIYERDIHVRLRPTFVRIATTPDEPWKAGTASAELVEVKNYWTAHDANVSRAAVLFLSGRNLGGGLAYRSGLCTNDFGYAVVGSIKGSFTRQPSDDTWDLVSVSHELGHIFGSRHSFCYKRDDGATWYDECYSGPPSGGCYSGPVQPSNGTIMSYCYVAGGSMSRINPISFSDGDPAMTSVMRATAENALAVNAGGCLSYAPETMPELNRR